MTARAPFRAADVTRAIRGAADAGRPIKWFRINGVTYGLEPLTDEPAPDVDMALWQKGLDGWGAGRKSG